MMYHRKHRLVAQLLTARNGAQAASVGKETKEEKREVRRPHPSGNEVCILYQRHCISLLSCIHNVLQQHILYILIELEEIRCISRHDLPQNLHNFQVTRVRPCLKIAGRMSSEDPRRPLNRGETEKRMRGGVLESVGQISRGCRGSQLSFVLPAIFCHPFALLFSAVETASQSILVESLYRATLPEREKEREEAARGGRETRRGEKENSPTRPERARGEEERAE